MALLENLIFAEMAAKYANDALRGKASNRSEDLAHIMLQEINAVFGEDTKEYLEFMSGQQQSEKMNLIYQNRVAEINTRREERSEVGERLNSAAILRDGVGNCFEHSVLACRFLQTKNVPCLMAETDDNTNHVFVVIGAPPNLAGTTINVTQMAPGALNGGLTVICDPWYHEWFSVQQDWGRKMWSIFSKTTKFSPMPNPVPLTLTSGALVT